MAAHVSVSNRMNLSSSTYFLIIHEISIVNNNCKCYIKQIVKI